MRQLLQLFLLFLTITTSTIASAQVIYVKAGATGANNGSTWADAFTNLDNALAVAAPGNQIWVAAGTYKPSNPAPNTTFIVIAGVELYGGFAGNETALDQRNYETNLSILSGDILGNDIAGDFVQNKADNVRHVVYVQNGNPADRAVIDGFRIKGGNTSNTTTDPDLTQRGGGILAVAQLTVRNCFFSDNFARSGGGVAAIAPAGTGLIVDNCIFEGNYANSQSAGIYMRQLTAGEVNRCIFRNNLTNRGCVYPETATGIVIDSCLFEHNETGASQFGAALFTWQSNFVLSNSVIRNNTAHNGAGMYNDGREGISAFVIDNCLFDSNTVINYGGTCMYNWIANFEVKNSTFKDNYAPNTGSAMYNRSCVANIHDCLFENGQTGQAGGVGFGGAIANYSAGSNVTIEDCIFRNNNAARSGGAVTVGFTASTTLKDCLFEENTATYGGAVFNQNDSTTLVVEGCAFNENGAENTGGAINLSSGVNATVKNSVFFSNSANVAGAIDISEDSLDLAVLNVENSIFRDNFCLTQAGAINVNNAEVNLANCLFAANLNLSTLGAGGVISNNASNDIGNGNMPVSNISEVRAVNCTFAANFGPLGSSVGQYENDGEAILTLQNCILADELDSYAIEEGTPEVISLGGNLCADISMLPYLTGPNDVNGELPLFADISAYDFTLPTNSPAIDIGIAAGAPPTDIDGNPRVNEPDGGCYENQDVVGIFDAPKTRLLQVSPNPAVDFIQLIVKDDQTGAGTLEIVTLSGKVVRSLNVEKNTPDWQIRVDVKDLPAGAYVAKARIGDAMYLGKVVKH